MSMNVWKNKNSSKYAGKFEDRINYKEILDSAIVLTHEIFVDKSTFYPEPHASTKITVHVKLSVKIIRS